RKASQKDAFFAMRYFVYILFSPSSKRFYCGQTEDFDRRLIRHNSGRNKSTKSGIPWEVVHLIECPDRSTAVNLELKIKKRGIKRFLMDNAVPLPWEAR